MTLCVGVYLVDKAYGGPEEGGWWFTYGEPQEGDWLRFLRTFKPEESEAAYAYARRLNRALQFCINRHRRSIDSVLSEGVYRAHVSDGLPKAFPETRPHYE